MFLTSLRFKSLEVCKNSVALELASSRQLIIHALALMPHHNPNSRCLAV